MRTSACILKEALAVALGLNLVLQFCRWRCIVLFPGRLKRQRCFILFEILKLMEICLRHCRRSMSNKNSQTSGWNIYQITKLSNVETNAIITEIDRYQNHKRPWYRRDADWNLALNLLKMRHNQVAIFIYALPNWVIFWNCQFGNCMNDCTLMAVNLSEFLLMTLPFFSFSWRHELSWQKLLKRDD